VGGFLDRPLLLSLLPRLLPSVVLVAFKKIHRGFLEGSIGTCHSSFEKLVRNLIHFGVLCGLMQSHLSGDSQDLDEFSLFLLWFQLLLCDYLVEILTFCISRF
jgi:hypothetical protein